MKSITGAGRILLLLAAFGLVAWGMLGEGQFAWHSRDQLNAISARHGRLVVLHGDFDGRVISAVSLDHDRGNIRVVFTDGDVTAPFDDPILPLLSPSLGTRYTRTRPFGFDLHLVAAPQWLCVLLVVTAVGSGPAVRTMRRHRRRQHGRCIDCGYDLRATPGTCPECGATA